MTDCSYDRFMKSSTILFAVALIALVAGFTGPTWAVPVYHGVTDAVRFVFETQLAMMVDGQAFRFGCF